MYNLIGTYSTPRTIRRHWHKKRKREYFESLDQLQHHQVHDRNPANDADDEQEVPTYTYSLYSDQRFHPILEQVENNAFDDDNQDDRDVLVLSLPHFFCLQCIRI